MKLIAKKSMRYAGRSLVAGDEFEASDKDARLLKAIKKAADYVAPVVETEDKPKRGRGKYNTRQMKAFVADDFDVPPVKDIEDVTNGDCAEDSDNTTEE